MNNSSIYKKKQKIPVYNVICTNCEKNNHDYKHCTQPVTSWGVILVDLCGADIILKDVEQIEIATMAIAPIANVPMAISPIANVPMAIAPFDTEMGENISFMNIRLLMISRKFSLGYIEFVRGRYKPHMIDQTIYLFKQMKQEEIDLIKLSQDHDKGFDFLWQNVWQDRAKSSFFTREYTESKYNYELLRAGGKNGSEIGIDYILRNVKPEYLIDEWGFPKGRRHRMESAKECAVREFKEETGYIDNDFKVIDHIKPLIEDFTGTNGIRYRHIYYIAHLISGKMPTTYRTYHQIHEVGNIGFFDFHTASEYIREYHTDRKQIIKNLQMFYLNQIGKNRIIVKKNKNLIKKNIGSSVLN